MTRGAAAALMAYRDLLGKRADHRTASSGSLRQHPDLLKYAVEGSPMPWDTDPFAQTARRALENAGPEERHAHYGDLELRVVTLGKDELEISGVFGRETLYICNP